MRIGDSISNQSKKSSSFKQAKSLPQKQQKGIQTTIKCINNNPPSPKVNEKQSNSSLTEGKRQMPDKTVQFLLKEEGQQKWESREKVMTLNKQAIENYEKQSSSSQMEKIDENQLNKKRKRGIEGEQGDNGIKKICLESNKDKSNHFQQLKITSSVQPQIISFTEIFKNFKESQDERFTQDEQKQQQSQQEQKNPSINNNENKIGNQNENYQCNKQKILPIELIHNESPNKEAQEESGLRTPEQNEKKNRFSPSQSPMIDKTPKSNILRKQQQSASLNNRGNRSQKILNEFNLVQDESQGSQCNKNGEQSIQAPAQKEEMLENKNLNDKENIKSIIEEEESAKIKQEQQQKQQEQDAVNIKNNLVPEYSQNILSVEGQQKAIEVTSTQQIQCQQQLNETQKNESIISNQKQQNSEILNVIQTPMLNTQIQPLNEQTKLSEKGSFNCGDKAKRITSCQKKEGKLLMEIEWQPREDGNIPKKSVCTSQIIRQFNQEMLLDFYESKLIFSAAQDKKAVQTQAKQKNEP